MWTRTMWVHTYSFLNVPDGWYSYTGVYNIQKQKSDCVAKIVRHTQNSINKKVTNKQTISLLHFENYFITSSFFYKNDTS